MAGIAGMEEVDVRVAHALRRYVGQSARSRHWSGVARMTPFSSSYASGYRPLAKASITAFTRSGVAALYRG